MSASWVDVLAAVSGSVAAVLSIIAVLVTIKVARESSLQVETIASDQKQRELRSYHAERKSEFREQCRAVLTTANAIETTLNPRVSELLSTPSGPVEVEAARTHLAQLSSEVNLLTTFTDTSIGIPDCMHAKVTDLLEEAAWVYSDSLHLAILALDTDEDDLDVDLRDPQGVVDELLNGSAVNLEPRLMPGYDPESPNGEGPGAHDSWKDAYRRREARLLESGIVDAQPLPSSLTEVAARSLGWVSIRRFADLASEILSAWGAVDAAEPQRNTSSESKK